MGTRLGHTRYRRANPRPSVLSWRALNAEEIAVTLSVARADITISLKELQVWGLVKVTHLIGDRRDRTDYRVRSFA
jgi:hypothetical protein